MNLFITGATGFVGFNLVIAARNSRRYDRIFASIRNPEKFRLQLAAAGIHDPDVITLPWDHPIPEDIPIDHAVHCAGVLFARNRDAYFAVNVTESLRVLSSLPASTRLVVLSSQSAGGPTPDNQHSRSINDADHPITYYGESKLAMESEIRSCRPDVVILRPPMILGPRDTATLPLFRLASGLIRPKPGLKPKFFSWIAVGDLVRDTLALLERDDWHALTPRLLYAAAPDVISDTDLVGAAARIMRAKGIDLAIPHPILRIVACMVDRIPSLRAANPSLTRDRVREIFADRWVVDASAYRQLAGSHRYHSLINTLAETHAWNRDHV